MPVQIRSSATVCVRPPGPVACGSCDLNEICRLCGLLALEGRQPVGALRTVPAGTPLYQAGTRADALYAVRQGMLKKVHVTADGDERILAVSTPGEALGLEAFSLGKYACDVIALQPVVCCELPLAVLEWHGTRVRELATAVIRLLSAASVPPDADPARGSIRKRVVGFLVDLAGRLRARGFDGEQFSVGLSRQEIADLLDTRTETVSRVLQALDREHAIRVRGNRVTLLRLSAAESEENAPLFGSGA